MHPVVDLAGWLRLLEERTLASEDDGVTVDREPATSPLKLVASKAGERLLRESLRDWDGSRSVVLLVGPEGGFDPAEADVCARSGFEAVRLGSRTLRFETAAIVALGVVVQHHEPPGRIGYRLDKRVDGGGIHE